jgi:aminoglycoside phosphotransferase (APT) family kinase protein
MLRGRRASDPTGQDVVGDELLELLRAHLNTTTLEYAEAPRTLRGGFFTENRAFRLADPPPGWDAPLVVRLFPSDAPADLAARESAVQSDLVRQGYPAAPVRFHDPVARVDGRRFFVMDRLPGRALVGGMRPGDLLRAARHARRLPEVTAAVQHALHQQDASTLEIALGAGADGVDRALATIQSRVDDGADGFGMALRWLREQRPASTGRRVVCHGDLWGGNILVDGRGQPTGVLDWSTSAIGAPGLDVGATALAFCIVPVPMPRRARTLVQRRGRALYDRFLQAYRERSDADLTDLGYYEALRCAGELAFVADWRLARTRGETDLPRPSWDVVPGELAAFFRARAGAAIVLPPSPGS